MSAQIPSGKVDRNNMFNTLADEVLEIESMQQCIPGGQNASNSQVFLKKLEFFTNQPASNDLTLSQHNYTINSDYCTENPSYSLSSDSFSLASSAIFLL